jgi:hypothetical protein
MPSTKQSPKEALRRIPASLMVLAAAPVMLGGVWLMTDGSKSSAPPLPSRAEAVPAAGAIRHPAAKLPAPMPFAVPERVRISRIGVDAPLMPLDLDKQQHLQVPPDDNRNLAGWYERGPAPGGRGPAVLAGHVDTMKGPAVFYGLGALHQGDTIQVTRADRRTAIFTIYGIEVYLKSEFPAAKVYGPTPGPELRVITCGGEFVKGRGYLGDVVVYARLTGTS